MRREDGPSMDQDMKCPKCGRFALHFTDKGVGCKICGYDLTPGQVDRYRLFQLLKEEDRRSRQRR